ADTEVVQPLIRRLGPDPYATPLQDFFRARLQADFPTLVIQDGEPIDDLGIKPNRIMLEPFRQQITQISTNQSTVDPRVLNAREADSWGANFLVLRRPGAFAVGPARLFFSNPQFALITPVNGVFTNTGLRFLPVENQSISAENMLFNTDGNLFFFDVATRA